MVVARISLSLHHSLSASHSRNHPPRTQTKPPNRRQGDSSTNPKQKRWLQGSGSGAFASSSGSLLPFHLFFFGPSPTRPRLHRIRPCSTSSNQSPLPFTSTHTYIHRLTMAEPWLGGYQNVDASDAYLTPHQRAALQHFRAEQGSGFRFWVRQHWERLSGEKRREG